MANLNKLIKEFRTELSDLALIKEYNAVAKEYHESKEIQQFETDEHTYQTKMIMARENSRKEEFLEYKAKWQEIHDLHVTHPLYQNYQSLRNEVGDLLNELSNILNDIN